MFSIKTPPPWNPNTSAAKKPTTYLACGFVSLPPRNLPSDLDLHPKQPKLQERIIEAIKQDLAKEKSQVRAAIRLTGDTGAEVYVTPTLGRPGTAKFPGMGKVGQSAWERNQAELHFYSDSKTPPVKVKLLP